MCPPGARADLLIEHVTVVSPEEKRPLPDRHVLIRGDRIAEIRSSPIATTADVSRIDGRGRYLTPGIMDSHVHVGTTPGLPLPTEDEKLAALDAAYAAQQPRSYLYFGVTQVLDLIGLPERIAAFDAQPVRPDLFRCGPAVVLDGYPTVWVDKSVRYRLLPNYVYEPKNAAKHPLPAGEDPARHTPEAVVRDIAASDARCVKLFIEDGFGVRSDWPIMSLPTLKRVVAEAHRHRLPVVAHANALDMQRIALEAGVDVIAHGLWNWNEYHAREGIPDAIAKHLRSVHAAKVGFQATLRVLPGTADLFRRDTLADPILAKVVPPDLLAWYATDAGGWFRKVIRPDFDDMTDEQIEQAQLRVGEQGMRAVRYLAELGQPFLLGSDTPSAPTYGNQPGYDTYREMQLMALSGVSLPAILQAATINNARQFGLDRDYGTVERGKIANLLLLEANPLASIDAWSTIDNIILRGVMLERESLAADRRGP